MPGALLGILAVLAWRSINYVSGLEPGTDSGIFLSIGWHVKEGHILYREAWDHKPPLVPALNALAQALGGESINPVRVLERVFAVGAVTALFGTVWMAFGRVWLAGVAGLLYLLHSSELFILEHGNITEEYGAAFSLVGMLAAVAARRPGGRAVGLSAVSGLAFSLAVFAKEPFLLVSIPWFVFLAWPYGGQWRAARGRGGAFLAGALAPAVVMMAYLSWHGAAGDWLDVLAYNLAHEANTVSRGDASWLEQWIRMADAKVFHTLRLTQVAAGLGLVALGAAIVRRGEVPLLLATAGSALAGLFATSLSGGYSGHYYLFFIPSYVLLAVAGLHFVTVGRRAPVQAGLAILGALLLVPNRAELETFGRQLAAPAGRWDGHWLSRVIAANTTPGDKVWAPWKSMLNAEAGRASPTRYLFVFDHLFRDTPASTTEEKLALLRDELRRDPPRIVVLNAPPGRGRTRRDADAFLARSGLTDWIAGQYRPIIGSAGEPYEVLVLKRPPEEGGASEAVMRAGLDALEREPLRAAFLFHHLLELHPSHYGAHYQLARSLDAAGQRVAARRAWGDVLTRAEGLADTASVAAARARLATPDHESEAGWMGAGLSCLYQLRDAGCGVKWFRRVLTANPGHYGANFQLARALDLASESTQADLQWRGVLRAAEAVADSATIGIARRRLSGTR